MKPDSTTFRMGRGGQGTEQGGCWLESEVMGLEGDRKAGGWQRRQEAVQVQVFVVEGTDVGVPQART